MKLFEAARNEDKRTDSIVLVLLERDSHPVQDHPAMVLTDLFGDELEDDIVHVKLLVEAVQVRNIAAANLPALELDHVPEEDAKVAECGIVRNKLLVIAEEFVAIDGVVLAHL